MVQFKLKIPSKKENERGWREKRRARILVVNVYTCEISLDLWKRVAGEKPQKKKKNEEAGKKMT